MGERFAWFTDRLEQLGEIACLTPDQFSGMIEEYVNKTKNFFYDIVPYMKIFFNACLNIYFNSHRYLDRFNEEIETINIKQSISKNRSNQHANRLAIINMTIEKEKNEYNGAGIGT